MSEPIGQRDFDYLAKKLGFEDMKAIQAHRKAEEVAAYEAEQAALAKAMEAEVRVRIKAEDGEISKALKGRMVVELNGAIRKDAKGYQDLVCPLCGELPDFTREMLLACMRRATIVGEDRIPMFYAGPRRIPYPDSVPAGPGVGLIVCSPSFLYQGTVACSECGKSLGIRIEVQCAHDGKTIKGLQGRPCTDGGSCHCNGEGEIS